MTLYFVIVLAYFSSLLFIRPQPESLKADRSSFKEHFQSIKLTLFFGFLISTIFLLTSKFEFHSTDDVYFKLLAINNVNELSNLWFYQIVTNTFVHINFLHLFVNLSGLGIASVYERRVGSKRYMEVLVIGSLASTCSIFFYSEDVFISGISGGIFALAAAYFTDNENLSFKEWFFAILLFLILLLIFTLGDLHDKKNTNIKFNIDYIGHLLGAVSAIIYCRLRPIKQ